jgi:hypothetical protein
MIYAGINTRRAARYHQAPAAIPLAMDTIRDGLGGVNPQR